MQAVISRMVRALLFQVNGSMRCNTVWIAKPSKLTTILFVHWR
ncbi:Uncharacterised protein [Vibrio cholerae]|nr:Uncharacterised protein [Vibrio cholerae]CSD03653.1 Uncharacterised protein [Vibrio cholerae]